MPGMQLSLDKEFVCLFDGKGGARAMELNELIGWKPQDGVLWVHLNDTSSEDIA